MATTPATPKPAPHPSTPAHGWRVTWPMVLGWLAMIAAFIPMLLPYLTGEKPFDAAAGALLFGGLIGILNHSPAATRGGGLIFPPATLLALAFLAATVGCGGATGVTRTSYALEEARCVSNERVIVDRANTTREQDETDLAAERARCDAALAAIGGAR